ncbi:MAG TPA: NYN domain-containing protein [Ktedonobacteraceae bacterium]
MTTDTNQPENNDVQVSVVEQSHDLDTSATSSSPEVAAAAEEQVAQTHTQSPGNFQVEQQEGDGPVLNGDSQDNHDTTATDTDDSADAALTAGISESAPITPAAQIVAEEMLTFAYPDEGALRNVDIVRPFTDFIAEFRQAEEGSGSPPLEQTVEGFPSFPLDAEQSPEQSTELLASTEEHVPADLAPKEEEQVTPEVQKPAAHKERPVSPLLRPATRVRMPRHGGGRHREDPASAAKETTTEAHKAQSGRQEGEAAHGSQSAASTEPVMTGETPVASTLQAEPAPAEVSTEEQPKPARRYRFDRPIPASPVAPTQPVQQVRSEESKENRVTTATPAHADSGQQVEREAQPAQPPTKQNGSATHNNGGQQTPKAAPEPASSNGGGTTTATPSSTSTHDRRRRSQERQHEREKGQTGAPPAAAADTTPVAEVTEAAGHPQGAPAQEMSPEDLPPLEYSELQAATSRRRRRRRPTSGGSTTPAASSAKPAVPEQPPTGVTTPSSPAPVPASPVALPRNVAVPGTAAPTNPYNIVSGYTVSQMNQGNDGTGPFMGPEPSPARGSNTLREPRIRNEAQRSSSYTARHGEPTTSPISINQLANVISQSFQSQTDRMLAELRHANQVPTNVSVAFPPFPSTERVGVFVDVANLLYSARTQRLTIDFGKLLDFLRGNRRLVRAHAYCPTSPQPGDEQMFLQAVKGLGYRITTKNYKTFSSGAKKADLDLDLCMDVVRLVDGRAVDCVVLVSGDSDFMPMLDYCSDHGVRVEVAAFDESMSATLRQSCDLFINLSMLDEIRA